MPERVVFRHAGFQAAGQTFRDVLVHPATDLLRDGGPFFRGGPAWPNFALQVTARHCWFPLPIPVDSRPMPAHAMPERLEEGVWCGPVSPHFGHMVADFAMRIAASARALTDCPLLFSLRTEPRRPPKPFFGQIVAHLGVARERIVLVERPTRVGRLHVLPQAERRYGGGPSRDHLALMDEIAGPAPARDLPHLFVSRAGLPSGRFAGEGILESALEGAGVAVLRPETVPLAEQFALYRRARHLIFSEGSALHALQLLGRLDAEITVLGRRPRRRLAAASLRPRVSGLRYLHALRGLVYGLRASGAPQRPAGISILDERQLLDRLARIGLDLGGGWDQGAYERCRDEDIDAWIARRRAGASHPGDAAMIERRLRALRLRR